MERNSTTTPIPHSNIYKKKHHNASSSPTAHIQDREAIDVLRACACSRNSNTTCQIVCNTPRSWSPITKPGNANGHLSECHFRLSPRITLNISVALVVSGQALLKNSRTARALRSAKRPDLTGHGMLSLVRTGGGESVREVLVGDMGRDGGNKDMEKRKERRTSEVLPAGDIFPPGLCPLLSLPRSLSSSLTHFSIAPLLCSLAQTLVSVSSFLFASFLFSSLLLLFASFLFTSFSLLFLLFLFTPLALFLLLSFLFALLLFLLLLVLPHSSSLASIASFLLLLFLHHVLQHVPNFFHIILCTII